MLKIKFFLFQMKLYLLLLLAATAIAELPPSCDRRVYCNSELLHHVQMARLFHDSKTFVDQHMLQDEESTLQDFQNLLDQTNKNPSRDQLSEFVNSHFTNSSELEKWTPTDYKTDPDFLVSIKDEDLRQFAKDINAIWLTLGRKVKKEVLDKPDQYSLIPVTHGFIIPGGRFTELYYWDTYWIIKGLLISGMQETVKGKIENLIQLLTRIGHVPNGSRWYYQQRSQPPLLTAMMMLYIEETADIDFLRTHIDSLESELEYWLDTQAVSFDVNGKSRTLLHYDAPSNGPRPESYYEDYTNAQRFATRESKEEFYVDLKSAAESGWDFSTRWFVDDDGTNRGNLTTIHTRNIIPVDLNAIFANAMQNVADFQGLLNNPRKGALWAYLAKQWRNTLEEVLWNEEDGIWYDYDIDHNQHRKYFYPSNVAPLWMEAVEEELVLNRASRVLEYLKKSTALELAGGIPASLTKSGEQWDYPNAWPPLVSIVVDSMEALGSAEGNEMAFKVAQNWVRACRKGFLDNGQMFEKYDVETPGVVGGGGEYTVQDGFGWSNGVVLEFLAKYGNRMTACDEPSTTESDADLLVKGLTYRADKHK